MAITGDVWIGRNSTLWINDPPTKGAVNSVGIGTVNGKGLGKGILEINSGSTLKSTNGVAVGVGGQIMQNDESGLTGPDGAELTDQRGQGVRTMNR